jgi:hypothetical protein
VAWVEQDVVLVRAVELSGDPVELGGHDVAKLIEWLQRSLVALTWPAGGSQEQGGDARSTRWEPDHTLSPASKTNNADVFRLAGGTFRTWVDQEVVMVHAVDALGGPVRLTDDEVTRLIEWLQDAWAAANEPWTAGYE